MARLKAPSEGSRLAYRADVNGRPLTSMAGTAVTLWDSETDGALADVQTLAGQSIEGSALIVNSDSLLPLFLLPEGADTVWAQPDGVSARFPIYAREDDRLDQLEEELAQLGAGLDESVLAEAAARTAADEAEAQARASADDELQDQVDELAVDLAAEGAARAAGDALALQKSANLGDVANAATSRDNLGLGTAAVHDHTDYDAAGAAAAAQTAAAADATAKVATEAAARAAADALKADLVGGKVPTSQLPSMALGTAVPVADEAAMLALSSADVRPGDVAVRADGAGTFMLVDEDPSDIDSWLLLNAPTDAVTSVNGQTGTAVLSASDVGADTAAARDAAIAGYAQPLDPDLTAIAGLDSGTAGALATDGAGWIRKPWSAVKADLGLGNVDNTSDANKPVSTAQQAALDLKAPLASPALTGNPTAPTQAAGTNSTRIATTAYADAAVAVEAARAAAAEAAMQPLDADLTTIAGLDSGTAGALATDGAGWIRKTWAQVKSDLGLIKADVGLGNVDNTSDANKPISTATAAALAAKADLVGGLIPTSQIPALATSETVVVASQAAMLALTSSQVQPGDLAVRTDGAGTFILTAADPSVLANWTRLNAPTDTVTSVNGQTGTVVLGKGDIGLGNVDNTSDANKPVSTVQQTALDLKAPLASPALTGNPTAPTQTPGTNNTRVATTAYTDLAVGAVATVYTRATKPAATGSGALVFVSDDGAGTLFKDTAVGVWTALNPGELAYAENVSNTKQTVSPGAGATANADIPGCSITVPVSTRPVWIEGEIQCQQTVTGTGGAYCQILETTSGSSVLFVIDTIPLPNVGSGGTNGGSFFTVKARKRLSSVATPRTFKLNLLVLSTTLSTPVVQSQNGPATPSTISARVA